MMMPPQDPFFSRLQPQMSRQGGGLHHRALLAQLGGGLGDAAVPGLTPQITPDPTQGPGAGRMPWQLAPPDQQGPTPTTSPVGQPPPDPMQPRMVYGNADAIGAQPNPLFRQKGDPNLPPDPNLGPGAAWR